ncbi:SapB/AmfS family lanthipeptide [Kineosporia succinea]|uniref:SapB/AmfS family lantipeptide n=1 Tax=Kineosporia succinea TaxID=84632 RepID=A0ABT9PFV9_9ACTN|nr:SapB/AmfS family lanthipeptide [Kineosporia succinea]MDP9831045.1 hypothetical protein [Kineosporia succinea]
MNQILDLQTLTPDEQPEDLSLLNLCGQPSTASLLLCG